MTPLAGGTRARQDDLPIEGRGVLDDDRHGDVLREGRHRHQGGDKGCAGKRIESPAGKNASGNTHQVSPLNSHLVPLSRSIRQVLAYRLLSIKNILAR
ncbi:hypothetical protein ABIA13_000055 [Sinorhizobium fredii]